MTDIRPTVACGRFNILTIKKGELKGSLFLCKKFFNIFQKAYNIVDTAVMQVYNYDIIVKR